jgi:hypothetical protein
MYMVMVQDDRKNRLDQQIDENLRKVYQRTLEEDVPERFHDLLRKLKDQGKPE